MVKEILPSANRKLGRSGFSYSGEITSTSVTFTPSERTKDTLAGELATAHFSGDGCPFFRVLSRVDTEYYDIFSHYKECLLKTFSSLRLAQPDVALLPTRCPLTTASQKDIEAGPASQQRVDPGVVAHLQEVSPNPTPMSRRALALTVIIQLILTY